MSKPIVLGDMVYHDHLPESNVVTVSSISHKFGEFTVGIPNKKVSFDCGHWFLTGADQSRFKSDQEGNPTSELRTNYHCVKCQKEVGIVEWEE